MNDNQLKVWLDSPDEPLRQLAFQARQGMARRAQADAKVAGLKKQIDQLNQQLQIAVGEANHARGYESGILDSIRLLAHPSVVGEDRKGGGRDERCGCQDQSSSSPDGEVRSSSS